ncbi:MAG TPA: hypothetical protein VHU44_15890 [Acidobacteriaceae bacterium]|jgi:hypothetical protein|nr:hypothetical protein [Acidobacteriaceae bacterium]
MRSSMILPLVLFAALPLAAQQPLKARARSQFRFPPDHMACPVGLRVDRRSSVISREVDGKPIPTGQGLVLHFFNTPERRVISADITVHGNTGAVIAQPLSMATRARELTEDFHLTGSATEPLVEKSLWTARIDGITWLELTGVTFSDGTSWQRSVPSECRIEPSLFVLVK